MHNDFKSWKIVCVIYKFIVESGEERVSENLKEFKFLGFYI